MVPYSGFCGGGCLVDVYPGYGCSVRVGAGAADGVIEEQYLLRAGHVVQQESLDFGVVVLLDPLVV